MEENIYYEVIATYEEVVIKEAFLDYGVACTAQIALHEMGYQTYINKQQFPTFIRQEDLGEFKQHYSDIMHQLSGMEVEIQFEPETDNVIQVDFGK